MRKRRHALNYSEDEKQQLAWNDLLIDLNSYLEQGDMSNNDFNVLMPDESLQDVTMIEDSMEHDPDAESFFEENFSSLNEDQIEIFNSITEKITNKRGGLHRIDAPGGSGKTWLANIILCWTRKAGGIAIAAIMSCEL